MLVAYRRVVRWVGWGEKLTVWQLRDPWWGVEHRDCFTLGDGLWNSDKQKTKDRDSIQNAGFDAK